MMCVASLLNLQILSCVCVWISIYMCICDNKKAYTLNIHYGIVKLGLALNGICVRDVNGRFIAALKQFIHILKIMSCVVYFGCVPNIFTFHTCVCSHILWKSAEYNYRRNSLTSVKHMLKWVGRWHCVFAKFIVSKSNYYYTHTHT